MSNLPFSMEFNFQKAKPPSQFEFPFGNSRDKNISEEREEVPNNDFNLQKSNRPQLRGPTNFSVLPNFNTADNPSNFPQFMMGPTSPDFMNEETFSHPPISTRKEIEHVDIFQRRPESRGGGFFVPQACLGTSLSRTPSGNELNIPPEFTEHNISYQRKLKDSGRISEELQRNKQQVLMKSQGPSGETEVQNMEMNKGGGKSLSPSKQPNQSDQQSSVLDKVLSFSGFPSELEEFSLNYTKILSDKMELEMQKQRLEGSVKEYEDKCLNFQNMYEDMKQKFSEELKNRESVETRMIYLDSVIEAVEKHCNNIRGTLNMYKDINKEHTERHNKTILKLDKLDHDYKEALEGQKASIEVLQKQVVELQKIIENKSEELSKMKESMKLLSEESEVKLAAEQVRCTTLELNLASSQEIIKKLKLQQEALEKTLSEKYSSLQDTHTDLQASYEDLKKENVNLRLYLSKCGELEEQAQKLQDEKEELLSRLEITQQNLLKSEDECTKLTNRKEQLDLELQKANDTIFKIREELSRSQDRLTEAKLVVEKLLLEIQDQTQEIQSKSEEIEVLTGKCSRLEDKLKANSEEMEDKENVILELKKHIFVSVQELSDMKKEISKNEEKNSLHQKTVSDLELQYEQLQTKEQELINEILEKDQVIAQQETEISNMKSSLQKAIEDKNYCDQELQKSSSEVERIRQEMILNVDQYRGQYLAEFKDNEEKCKDLHRKYETACLEIEKLGGENDILMAQLKENDLSIGEHKKEMKEIYETIDKLNNELEKERRLSQRRTNDQSEELSQLEASVTQLKEEQKTLQRSNKDLKKKLIEHDSVREEKAILEKQIEVMQTEIFELREKAKVAEASFPIKPMSTSTPKENKKPQTDAHSSKKRVCFDEDMSDASSIDLSNLWSPGPSVGQSLSSSKRGNTRARKQRNTRNANSGKKFFHKAEDSDSSFFK